VEGGLIVNAARVAWPVALALLALAPMTSLAEVKSSKPDGFLIEQRIIVKADAQASWAALLQPSRWWSPGHTWSGSAANLSLEPKAGGCFCERWPEGEVEHARVVFLRKGQLLRMEGAFGPMQPMAVEGIVEFKLTPGKDGTQIDMSYRVTGGSDSALDQIAAPADGMFTEQMTGLKQLLDTQGEAARQ
jgi:uncharacterized protein YndB with AHSA1/START domain